jgi:hypothetical protein
MIRTAEDALAAMRKALAELSDAETRFEAGRAHFRKRHPHIHPDDANRHANTTWPPVVNAIADWQTAHTRIQSYGAVAVALLLAEFLGAAAAGRPDDLPAGGGVR